MKRRIVFWWSMWELSLSSRLLWGCIFSQMEEHVAPTWTDCRSRQQMAPRTKHLLQFRHRPEGEGYSGCPHPRQNAMPSHRTFGFTDFTCSYPSYTWCVPTARVQLSWSPTLVLTAPIAASLRWSYGNRHSQHDTPLGIKPFNKISRDLNSKVTDNETRSLKT